MKLRIGDGLLLDVSFNRKNYLQFRQPSCLKGSLSKMSVLNHIFFPERGKLFFHPCAQWMTFGF